MGAAAAVERLPQPGDVARVLADEERRELLVDHAGQRLVLRHAADLRLGLAPAGQAAFGVDAHQRPVERQGAAEIAGVLPLRRDRDVHPERLDRFDLHRRRFSSKSVSRWRIDETAARRADRRGFGIDLFGRLDQQDAGKGRKPALADALPGAAPSV